MHPSTQALLVHFTYEHLPDHLAGVSKPFCELAADVARELPDDPETTVCLRKLLEAKDCAVRAVVADRIRTARDRARRSQGQDS